MHVTGVTFIPNAGDTDLRFIHILFGHAGCVEHRLRGALAAGLGNTSTVFIERICHGVCFYLSLHVFEVVDIFDMFGKLVLTSTKNSVNTENLSDGIYMINITTKNMVITKKITITK